MLIAPAPYAAPDAYYFPNAGRMTAIEVRKGSSAIKFGPRTIGGAINLVSRSIGDETGGFAEARAGEDGLGVFHGSGTIRTDHVSGLAEVYISGNDGFKNLPNGGDTGFEVRDYLGKIRFDTGEDVSLPQWLELKLSRTDNNSNETYLGLTDEDFADDPYQRYAASALDRIETKHEQVQFTHGVEISDTIDLTTVAYYNWFERDWFKLDDLDFGEGRFRPTAVFSDPDRFVDVLAALRGEADSPDDAIQLRHNAREYYARGVQTVLGVEFETGAVTHDLELSVRYHEDQEDRLQNRENFAIRNEELVLTSIGAPGSQANRVGDAKAWSLFAQDDISAGRWNIVPGVRVEAIDLKRTDFSTSDPSRAAGPTRIRENSLTVVTPGVGITYEVSGNVLVLAGAYKGFNPPGAGSEDAKEETSLNLEAGLRYESGTARLELIGFYNDYTNILGTCTASVGCEGDVGDQFNGGAAVIGAWNWRQLMMSV